MSLGPKVRRNCQFALKASVYDKIDREGPAYPGNSSVTHGKLSATAFDG